MNPGTEHWQRRLDVLAAQYQVPGASLGLLREGSDGGDDEVVEAATGVLNLGTGVETTVDSSFQIGSITKVWTATLVIQLVDEGTLTLDDPVADVLPELRDGGQPWADKVTMRHLLTHTSGIDGDVFTDTGRGDDCVERYVALVAGMPPTHPIGATFSYCNAGFTIAGRVVEVLTGETWDRALRARLIEPLGLAHTSTLPEEALLGRAALGHLAEPGQPVHPAKVWGLPRSVGPAGLISSTVDDLLAFAKFHLAGGRASDGAQLLSPESVALMLERQVDLPETHTLGDSWGLGWIRSTWEGHELVGHGGATVGQRAFFHVLPEQGFATALLTNGGHADDFARALLGEVFAELAGVTMPAPFGPRPDPGQVDPAPYVGTYARTSTRLDVYTEEDRLMLRTTDTGDAAVFSDEPVHTYELLPAGEEGEDVFVIRDPDVEQWTPVKFYTLDDGTPYVHLGLRATPKRSTSSTCGSGPDAASSATAR